MQSERGIMPDYEVRLQLNPSMVLNPNSHELSDLIKSVFKVESAISIHVEYLDTNSKDIYNAAWSTRIRKTENKKAFELTYKKRYSIPDGNIDLAIATCESDGFDGSNANYEPQLEWGFQTRTLSITRKKKIDSGNHGTDLPDLNDSRQMLINNAPDKFNNWRDNKGWGINALARSGIYGPVLVRRCIGMWNGLELDIEIWPIRDVSGTGIEHIVQISFKTADYQTVLNEQPKLVDFLRRNNWFAAKESFMTQVIMERYQIIPS